MSKTKLIPFTVAGGVLLLLFFFYNHLDSNPDLDPALPFTLICGALFGVALQRSRFCFFCILKDFFVGKDGRPLVGILTSLVIGSIGYLVLFQTWVSDPMGGYIPIEAHIGPVSWHLVLGGLLFGWGMVLSGSCISAHFYRLGEGSMLSPIALVGTVVGFMLAMASWNSIYSWTVADASVLWIPAEVGYGWATLLQVSILLAGIVWLLIRFTPENREKATTPKERPNLGLIWQKVAVDRWPTWVGGIAVGLISVVYFFRVEPLGVTAEINRIARLSGWSGLPERLEGMDSLAGCTPNLGPELWTTNGVFVLSLVLGSIISGQLAGQFKPKIPTLSGSLKSFIGGILLGFGAMISLGCTIGVTLSGIHGFAISGWIFTVAMAFGVWSGLKFKRT
ncbi:MAG: YeeE/YedE family protein [Bacteroidota bacterium]